MPPLPKVEKEEIMQAALGLVRGGGLSAVNARSVAAVLGCSCKPLFRIYESMDALKQDLQLYMDEAYSAFMSQRLDDGNILLSQSIAYVEFARQEGNLFLALFMNETCKGFGFKDIVNAPWNNPTIVNTCTVEALNPAQAKRLFYNVWLFTHGIATQIVANSINMPQKEVERLIINAYTAFLKQEAG